MELEKAAYLPVAERVAVLTNRPTSITLDGVRTLHLKLDVSSEGPCANSA